MSNEIRVCVCVKCLETVQLNVTGKKGEEKIH